MRRLLAELKPGWISLLRPDSGEGVEFECPTCGPTHHLVAYFSNPLDGREAAHWQEPKWERVGDDFAQLTIKPSMQYPCFHGWVENGEVLDLKESPLVLFGINGGKPVPVALSPLQALDIADQIIAKYRSNPITPLNSPCESA